MKRLEEMVKKVREMLESGKTMQEAHEELQAQGVDAELVHWAVRAAHMERLGLR